MITAILDCDGVLLNWLGGFRQFLWNRYRFYTDALDPVSSALHEWLRVPPHRAAQLVQEFNSTVGFANLLPCPTAVSGVLALQEIGSVKVVSSCGNEASTRVMRAANIHRVFGIGSQDVTCLPLGKCKHHHVRAVAHQRYPRTVVMVEDCFVQAQGGVAAGVTSYCIRRPWNRHLEELNPESAVIWVDDLNEVALAIRATNQPSVG